MSKERMNIAERVRLYEACKLVYDENPQLRPGNIWDGAMKLIPRELRPKQNTASISNMRMWLKETPKSKGTGKVVSWWPSEYSIVIRQVEQLRKFNPTASKHDCVLQAMQQLPAARRRTIEKSPNMVSDIFKLLAVLGPQVKRPSAADPYPQVPVPTIEEQARSEEPQQPQQAAPAAPQAPQTGAVSELGAMVFSMLGTAFNAAVKEAAAIVGKEIGDSVAKSVSDALYEMRMGILSSKRQVEAPPAPAPVVVNKPEAELPENVRKPKVCLIGLEPGREQILLREYPKLEFRFLNKNLPGDKIKDVAKNCDATYVFTKFVSHSCVEGLKPSNGGPGYASIKGAFEAIRLRLSDDFPKHAHAHGQHAAHAH